jgi:hypothetical protein
MAQLGGDRLEHEPTGDVVVGDQDAHVRCARGGQVSRASRTRPNSESNRSTSAGGALELSSPALHLHFGADVGQHDGTDVGAGPSELVGGAYEALGCRPRRSPGPARYAPSTVWARYWSMISASTAPSPSSRLRSSSIWAWSRGSGSPGGASEGRPRDLGRRPPGPALKDGGHRFEPDRLGDVVVHTGRQAQVAVAVHGRRRHGDDGGPPTAPRCGGSRPWPRSRPFLASGSPSGRRRSGSCMAVTASPPWLAMSKAIAQLGEHLGTHQLVHLVVLN